METNLINLMFNQIISNLQSFIANDITVMLLGMLTIIFITFAYFKIREFLSMSTEAREAKSAFHRYQANKDDWRAPLYKQDYYEKLDRYRAAEQSRDYELSSSSDYEYELSVSYNEDQGSNRSDSYYRSFT